MKKLLIALLFASSTAVMAAETKSFRVGGDIVRVGDSTGQLLLRAGKPLHQHTYNVDSGNGVSISATDFIYEIGNEVYTVTVKQGKVTKITWDRR